MRIKGIIAGVAMLCMAGCLDSPGGQSKSEPDPAPEVGAGPTELEEHVVGSRTVTTGLYRGTVTVGSGGPALEDLHVVAGFTPRAEVDADGAFDVRMNTAGVGLIEARLADGTTIATQVFPTDPELRDVTPRLGARSTALSLLFMQPGVWHTDSAVAAVILRILDELPETDEVAAAIDAALKADPRALAEPPIEVTLALARATTALHALGATESAARPLSDGEGDGGDFEDLDGVDSDLAAVSVDRDGDSATIQAVNRGGRWLVVYVGEGAELAGDDETNVLRGVVGAVQPRRFQVPGFGEVVGAIVSGAAAAAWRLIHGDEDAWAAFARRVIDELQFDRPGMNTWTTDGLDSLADPHLAVYGPGLGVTAYPSHGRHLVPGLLTIIDTVLLPAVGLILNIDVELDHRFPDFISTVELLDRLIATYGVAAFEAVLSGELSVLGVIAQVATVLGDMIVDPLMWEFLARHGLGPDLIREATADLVQGVLERFSAVLGAWSVLADSINLVAGVLLLGDALAEADPADVYRFHEPGPECGGDCTTGCESTGAPRQGELVQAPGGDAVFVSGGYAHSMSMACAQLLELGAPRCVLAESIEDLPRAPAACGPGSFSIDDGPAVYVLRGSARHALCGPWNERAFVEAFGFGFGAALSTNQAFRARYPVQVGGEWAPDSGPPVCGLDGPECGTATDPDEVCYGSLDCGACPGERQCVEGQCQDPPGCDDAGDCPTAPDDRVTECTYAGDCAQTGSRTRVRSTWQCRNRACILDDAEVEETAPCDRETDGRSCGQDMVCGDGACDEVCNDECSDGQGRCTNGVAQACRADWDGDDCTEWGGDLRCPLGCDGQACRDAEQCPGDCNGHGECDPFNGRCDCANGFDGAGCDRCADGYRGYPDCRPCVDSDGDGYYADCAPFDCQGHDNDRYIHPDHPEVWDVRDNDCDGRSDDVGLQRHTRYFRDWRTNGQPDYEHRFATSRPNGFEADGHWVDVFPAFSPPGDFCNRGRNPYAPVDICRVLRDGDEIQLWGDQGNYTLIAVAECTGRFGVNEDGAHISLYLLEGSGEHLDYRDNRPGNVPGFTCRRVGYVYGGVSGEDADGSVSFYRHQAGFGADEPKDHMWSPDSREGHPDYLRHDYVWRAPGGN